MLMAYATARKSTPCSAATAKTSDDAFKKISNGNTLNGPFDWAGVSDQYFAAIFLA